MRWSLPLVLVFLGASAAAGQSLALLRERFTVGLHGPVRSAGSLIPGETLTLSFDLAGLTKDPDGRVAFSLLLKVDGPDGKTHFVDSQDVGPVALPLGGTSVRHQIQVATGLDQLSGEYTARLTVVDRASKPEKPAEAKLETRFKVGRPELALVRTQISADAGGKVPTAGVGMLGQTLFVHTVVVGFAPAATGLGNVQVELGLPGGGKPLVVEFRDIPKDTKYLPLRFDLPLTQAGTARVTLRVTDLVSKKSASQELPIRVLGDE